MKLLPTINVNLLFTILVISSLAYYSYLSYLRIEKLNKYADWVNHTNVVKLKLEQTLSYLKDAETGQRTYLLTKDSLFLQPLYHALEKTDKTVEEIESLTLDNPKQQQNVKVLKALINDKYNFLSFLIKMKNQAPATAVNLHSYIITDKNKMDAIKVQVSSMTKIEDSLLREREKAKKDISLTTPLYSLTLSLVSLLIILIAFYKIRNDINKQKKLSEELAYSKYFLQNLLNATPNGVACYEAIRNNEEKIIDFRITYINKEVIKIFNLRSNDIIDKKCSEVFPHYYKSGSFKYFSECVESGINREYEVENIINNKPLWFHVFVEKLQDGVTVTYRDITDEKKEAKEQLQEYNRTLEKANSQIKEANKVLVTINKELEISNKELERSNEDLASFTYVASHDLQEPLRKIRMLLSLILRKDGGHLPKETKEYFRRIMSSTDRMRMLIEGISNFSGANASAITKEETDLNDLVKEVKNSMHNVIEEKNAVIKSSGLPKIKVVRFQFAQLFSNILENALKYSKDNIAPLIQISAEIVKGKDIGKLGADTKTNYWKVSIADNGIGFEQEYENKVFDIFQRLHDGTVYVGTGIGLAICKKIIQNHNGFIMATGNPGIGSTFNIFIPVQTPHKVFGAAPLS